MKIQNSLTRNFAIEKKRPESKIRKWAFNFLLIFFMARPFEIKADSNAVLKSMGQLKQAVSKIEKNQVSEEIRNFVKSGKPNRFVGSAGHQKAQKYLEERIRQIDPGLNKNKSTLRWESFTPDSEFAIGLYRGDFEREIVGKFPPKDPTYKKWDLFTKDAISLVKSLSSVKGKNLVWEKKGLMSPKDVIAIGAHYDTIAHNKDTLKALPKEEMPGADDNGSGVALALGLIQFLSQYDLPKTVRVIFFDFEEISFLGSRAYVQEHLNELKQENFKGLVNLEMLGHDSKRSDKIQKTGDMRIYIRGLADSGHAKDRDLAESVTKVGVQLTNTVRFDLISNDFNSSDHINFWQAGLPAVTFTQNWEDDFNKDRYHTANDFVETLNLDTYTQSWRYIIGGVAGWVFDL